jgi:hypothetical protein
MVDQQQRIFFYFYFITHIFFINIDFLLGKKNNANSLPTRRDRTAAFYLKYIS